MRLSQGPLDGAQPREHVLSVLRHYGVEVIDDGDDFYDLVDCEGDVVNVPIPDPVLSATINFLYRRFGLLHGFEITVLVRKH